MNYFEILGLSSTASAVEIKKAYRKLSFQFHPDRNPSDEAKKRYAQIMRAYKTLEDPVKKEAYMTGRASRLSLDPLHSIENYWHYILDSQGIPSSF